MDLAGVSLSRYINRIIIAIILLLVSGIIILFLRHRIIVQDTPPSPAPPETTANLTIKDFQHTASENGAIQWTLKADSASMYTTQNKAKLHQLQVMFYGKDGRDLTLRADEGELDAASNDMHLSGNVRAETSAYLLTTESLNYAHQSRMIHIKTPVTLKSALMTLTADAMTYHLATGAITCNGNVNGVFLKPDETPAK